MAGEGQHIHTQRLDIHRNMTDGLNRIGVEPGAMGMSDGGQLCNGLYGSDLIIGQHNGNQRGILTNDFFQFGRIHKTFRCDGQIGYFKALFFQRFGAVQNGVMLKCGGDEVLFALGRPAMHTSLQRPVIGFGAAGGEINFARFGIERRGHLTAGLFDGGTGRTPNGINAAGISIVLHQPRGHGLQHSRRNRCGGGVIGINKAFFHSNTLPLL